MNSCVCLRCGNKLWRRVGVNMKLKTNKHGVFRVFLACDADAGPCQPRYCMSQGTNAKKVNKPVALQQSSQRSHLKQVPSVSPEISNG